jgi:hypothetical protein
LSALQEIMISAPAKEKFSLYELCIKGGNTLMELTYKHKQRADLNNELFL